MTMVAVDTIVVGKCVVVVADTIVLVVDCTSIAVAVAVAASVVVVVVAVDMLAAAAVADSHSHSPSLPSLLAAFSDVRSTIPGSLSSRRNRPRRTGSQA